MLRTTGLVPIIAAAALAAAGCAEKPVSAPSGTGQGRAGAPTGGTCAGIAAIQCAAAGDFCSLPEGQCRMPDAGGTCTARPEVCTKEWRPVCGCDGRTYGNACEAQSAGASVQAQGECPKPAPQAPGD